MPLHVYLALQLVQRRAGAGRRVHEQRLRLGDVPQVACPDLLHPEIERPGPLRSLHRRQVTLVEQLEEAVLLLDVQHHDAVEELLHV